MKPIHYFLLLSAFAGVGLAAAMSIVIATGPLPAKKSSSRAAKLPEVSVAQPPVPPPQSPGHAEVETPPPARPLGQQASRPHVMFLKAAFRAQPLADRAPPAAIAPSNRHVAQVPEIRDWMLDDLLRDGPPRVANSSGRVPAASGNSIDPGQGTTGRDIVRTGLSP